MHVGYGVSSYKPCSGNLNINKNEYRALGSALLYIYIVFIFHNIPLSYPMLLVM